LINQVLFTLITFVISRKASRRDCVINSPRKLENC
jgi:hypothetical protein